MDSKTIRLAGVIAGIVVVLGILAIGAQYFSQISGGANAQVTDITEIPPIVSMPKEDYVTIKSLLDRYGSVSDLATKNQIIGQLRSVVDGLVK